MNAHNIPRIGLARARAEHLQAANELTLPVEIRQLPGESDAHYVKRAASIRALGALWLRHPAYTFRPLHSNNPEVWRPAHSLLWERVHAAAAGARASNPAFARAQAVLSAVRSGRA